MWRRGIATASVGYQYGGGKERLFGIEVAEADIGILDECVHVVTMRSTLCVVRRGESLRKSPRGRFRDVLASRPVIARWSGRRNKQLGSIDPPRQHRMVYQG